jgi:hypothetical protein
MDVTGVYASANPLMQSKAAKEVTNVFQNYSNFLLTHIQQIPAQPLISTPITITSPWMLIKRNL